jgi:hypothetical protein
MKSRILILSFIFAGLGMLLTAQDADALGLKTAPLEYKTTLKAGERQQGVVDISNPSGQAVRVKTSVQAFKQIDNSGGLQFYDDVRIAKGIKNDLTEFGLGPREALRMTFVIDGAILPQGDVYAAIFFSSVPSVPRNGVGEVVRVGTILSIINKTPGPRSAEITSLSLPFFQLSDSVDGTYKIKNTGTATSGFYPTVRISTQPGGTTRSIDSSLVFGGRERQNDFQIPTGFGIHYIEASYGHSKKGQWVVTVAPWMLIALIMVALIICIELVLFKRRRKLHRSKTDSTS